MVQNPKSRRDNSTTEGKKTFFMDKITIDKIKRQIIYWGNICNVYHK